MNPSPKDQIKNISKSIGVVDDYSFTVFDRQVHVAYQQPYYKLGQTPGTLWGKHGSKRPIAR